MIEDLFLLNAIALDKVSLINSNLALDDLSLV